MNCAVAQAIKMNLLDGFFKRHESEVLVNILTEFDQEKYDRCRRREGYNEGRNAGLAEGIQTGAHDKAIETARNMISECIPTATIAKCTGLSLDIIENLLVEV